MEIFKKMATLHHQLIGRRIDVTWPGTNQHYYAWVFGYKDESMTPENQPQQHLIWYEHSPGFAEIGSSGVETLRNAPHSTIHWEYAPGPEIDEETDYRVGQRVLIKFEKNDLRWYDAFIIRFQYVPAIGFNCDLFYPNKYGGIFIEHARLLSFDDLAETWNYCTTAILPDEVSVRGQDRPVSIYTWGRHT